MRRACNCHLLIQNLSDISNNKKRLKAGASVIIVNYPVQTKMGEIIVPTILVGKERFGPHANTWSIPCGHKKITDCCGYRAAVRETKEELKFDIKGRNMCFIHRGSFIIVTSADLVDVSREKINKLIDSDCNNPFRGIEYKEMSECNFIVVYTEETIDKFIANVNHQKYDKIDPPIGQFAKFVCQFLRKKCNWEKYASPLVRVV